MTERPTRHGWPVLALAAVLVAGAAAADEQPLPASGAMSPAPAVPRSLLLKFLADKSAFTLIDARSPEEYAAAHIAGAVNVPWDQVDDYGDSLPAALDGPVVVYCRTGRRAGKLKAQLDALGYSDVRVLQADQIFSSGDLMTFNCGATPEKSLAAPKAAAADAREEE